MRWGAHVLTTGGEYTGPPSGYRDYAQRQTDKGEAEYTAWFATGWAASVLDQNATVPAVPADFSRS